MREALTLTVSISSGSAATAGAGNSAGSPPRFGGRCRLRRRCRDRSGRVRDPDRARIDEVVLEPGVREHPVQRLRGGHVALDVGGGHGVERHAVGAHQDLQARLTAQVPECRADGLGGDVDIERRSGLGLRGRGRGLGLGAQDRGLQCKQPADQRERPIRIEFPPSPNGSGSPYRLNSFIHTKVSRAPTH